MLTVSNATGDDGIGSSTTAGVSASGKGTKAIGSASEEPSTPQPDRRHAPTTANRKDRKSLVKILLLKKKGRRSKRRRQNKSLLPTYGYKFSFYLLHLTALSARPSAGKFSTILPACDYGGIKCVSFLQNTSCRL